MTIPSDNASFGALIEAGRLIQIKVRPGRFGTLG
jgi:hypothetical protein